ncbi:MAG: hypothetical protein K9J16_07465 [Melioribacteraceae bacterium]|nr:hypothetical protein [Melioribacteraceae bacterium]MCF8353431.1 hypothetical protein [Melioribacteraceae bacterium]MCF8393919.1 hypothetical protein [Melioribacteraceae bacterium]MCF8418992.1 hypothetical protein [Melioribacteraceae bacterium]
MKKILIVLTLFTFTVIAQTRSGLMVGVQYESTSHTNPYVFVGGTDPLNPLSVQGFSDNTSHVYFPFGYASYSENGYSEFSSYALHELVVGVMNLLNSNKQYKYSTDKTYSGDSWADGYVPVLDGANSVSQQTNSIAGGNFGLEASFLDMDFLRLAYAGTMQDFLNLPVMLGFQGGVGNFGVHFAKVQEGHEPSEINNDGTGLVNFNEAVDLYFGPSIGYVTQIFPGDLAMLLVQYDWYYFIKGTGDEMRLDGNKLTFELTYFPFDRRKPMLKNLFFKLFYKTSTVPYMKKFADSLPVDYSFSKIGIGVNYFIL